MRDRAFTFIDRTKAVVGNRWVDRAWGLFLADPLGIVQRDAEFSWIVDPPADWTIACDGAPLSGSDFEPVEWTEENNPFGAAVTAQRTQPGLTVRLHTMAYHDAPALVRTMSLLKTGDSERTFTDIAIDVLNFGSEDVTFTRHHFPHPKGAAHTPAWKPAEETLIVRSGDDCGVIVGAEEGVVLDWTDGLVRFLVPEAIDPPANRPVSLPSAYLLAFKGPLNLNVESAHNAFMRLAAESRALRDPGDSTDDC